VDKREIRPLNGNVLSHRWYHSGGQPVIKPPPWFNLHLTGGPCTTNRTAKFRGGGPGTGRLPLLPEVGSVAKPELGNKHQCQNCGARFFDLNKSPVTCPKCGTIFHAAPLSRVAPHPAVADDEDPPAGAGTVLVPLEEADAGEDKVAAVADDDTEIEAVDDAFLEEEEEDADDVGDLIDGEIGDEEER
jgi:uncharacterized protein (TIGR02300 family)